MLLTKKLLKKKTILCLGLLVLIVVGAVVINKAVNLKRKNKRNKNNTEIRKHQLQGKNSFLKDQKEIQEKISQPASKLEVSIVSPQIPNELNAVSELSEQPFLQSNLSRQIKAILSFFPKRHKQQLQQIVNFKDQKAMAKQKAVFIQYIKANGKQVLNQMRRQFGNMPNYRQYNPLNRSKDTTAQKGQYPRSKLFKHIVKEGIDKQCPQHMIDWLNGRLSETGASQLLVLTLFNHLCSSPNIQLYKDLGVIQ